jgi:hypothetical protein
MYQIAFAAFDPLGMRQHFPYDKNKNKNADVSIIFERLQKLCYTQNVVKNYWLSRLKLDFISDINKNLNILAQTRLYFSI